MRLISVHFSWSLSALYLGVYDLIPGRFLQLPPRSPCLHSHWPILITHTEASVIFPPGRSGRVTPNLRAFTSYSPPWTAMLLHDIWLPQGAVQSYLWIHHFVTYLCAHLSAHPPNYPFTVHLFTNFSIYPSIHPFIPLSPNKTQEYLFMYPCDLGIKTSLCIRTNSSRDSIWEIRDNKKKQNNRGTLSPFLTASYFCGLLI